MRKIKIFNTCYLYKETLKNGLEVYLLPMKSRSEISINFGTKYGNRNLEYKYNNKEYKTPPGTAHFIEHKVFEDKEGSHGFEIFAKLNMKTNAYTSTDVTNYITYGAKYKKPALEALIKMVTDFNISKESIKKEIGIISEEIDMGDNDEINVMFETVQKNIVKKDNFKYSVAGTKSDIKKLDEELLAITHEAFYQPNNMFIVIAGSFNLKEVIKDVRELAGNLKNKSHLEKISPSEPKEVAKIFEEKQMDITEPVYGIAFKFENKESDSKLINKFYINIFLKEIFGKTSVFYIENKKQGLINLPLQKQTEIVGDYMIALLVSFPKDHKKLLKKINESLESHNISPEAFERAKKTFIRKIVGNYDAPLDTAHFIIESLIEHKSDNKNILTILKNLKYEKFNSYISSLDFKNYTSVFINNKNN